MGAGRERMIRQLMTESFGRSHLSAAAVGIHDRLRRGASPESPRPSQSARSPRLPTVDLRVLAFATVLTGITGMLFGPGPR